jgi:hypothetical protein
LIALEREKSPFNKVPVNNRNSAELCKEEPMKRRDHKYEVRLSQEQRHVLLQLLSSGKAPARKLAHARILLKID